MTGTPQAAENPRGMTQENDDVLWTQEQTAEYLGVSPRTVEGWRRRGTGPEWHRVGRFPRYFRRDVLAWVRRQRADGDRG